MRREDDSLFQNSENATPPLLSTSALWLRFAYGRPSSAKNDWLM